MTSKSASLTPPVAGLTSGERTRRLATLDWIDAPYRAVRDALPSLPTFFEHLRALIHYLTFDDWYHLMQFMIKRPDHDSPDSG